MEAARELWSEVERDLRKRVRAHADELTRLLDAAVTRDGESEVQRAQSVFASRQGELSALRGAQSVERLRKQLDTLEEDARQGSLFERDTRLEELRRRRDLLDDELRRRVAHLEALQQQLTRERERILTRLLPQRFRRRGDVQVLPVAVEIVLPGGDP